MINYEKEKIIIIGLGITGISCLNFLYHKKIYPIVMDINPLVCKKLNKFSKKILFFNFKPSNYKLLFNATLIILSPGVLLSSQLLTKIKKANIKIINDIEILMHETNIPIIAVTGTNGKSTVTKMIYSIFKYANYNVGIGGNIGIPVLNLLNKFYDFLILELSSFQLEYIYNLHTKISVILNITQDHMDRYPLGIQQYRNAKLKIYENAEICIFNLEDKLTYLGNKNSYYVNFGINTGNYHLLKKQCKTYLVMYDKVIFDCSKMKISGQHNYVNALVALSIAYNIGIPYTTSLVALKNFKGLNHNCKLVYKNNGIRWINNSKSTNIDSTKAALNSIHLEGTLHLLLGGDSKLANFLSLEKDIKNKNILIYCFGRDAKKISSEFSQKVELTTTLDQLLYIIKKKVQPKDVVLLSPSCASIDQFKNFKLRGKYFERLVKRINS